GLHQEVPEAADRQRLTIEALSQKPCFRLRYGGNPHTIAGTLRQLSVSGTVRPTVTKSPQKTLVCTSNLSSDPLRRFRATCLRSDIFLMGNHLRVEPDTPF